MANLAANASIANHCFSSAVMVRGFCDIAEYRFVARFGDAGFGCIDWNDEEFY